MGGRQVVGEGAGGYVDDRVKHLQQELQQMSVKRLDG